MVKSLYVVSDTHDDLEALTGAVDFIESEGVENSRIVHVGDLGLRQYTTSDLDDLIKSKDANTFISAVESHASEVHKSYREILERPGLPFTVIPGNYDNSLKGSFREEDIHNRLVKWDGVRVVGYGGAETPEKPWIGPPHMEILYDLNQVQLVDKNELKSLLENDPEIAVLHNPPLGLCDDMFNGNNVGSLTSRKQIERSNSLKLVLCGHIHEAGPNGNNPNGVRGVRGIEKENGKTALVINPGNLGRFEILDPRTLNKAMEFPYGTFVRVDIEEDGTPVRLEQYSLEEEGRGIGQVRKIGEFDLTP